MAEHWKSTPKYWCKHCATYVRDTKLERQNHEATAKHQGAVKRSLRDLHRGKEQEDREKERARREIERLNGVVERGAGAEAGSSTTSTSGPGKARGPGVVTRGSSGWGTGALSEGERKRQAEQLASLGVSIPQEFRGDLAMVGEWTVTSTTLVEDRPKEEDLNPEARAKGVHKRERTDEEKEEEDAIKGLFKKQRRWGRTARTAQGEGSEDLDALLSGGLAVKKSEEDGEDEDVKKEEEQKEIGETSVKTEDPASLDVKKEDEEAELPPPPIKKEDVEHVEAPREDTPVVAFKKRKPKNIRQK